MMWGNSQLPGPGPQGGSLSVVTTVWGVTSTSQSGPPYSQNHGGTMPGSMGPGGGMPQGPGMGGYNSQSMSPGMYPQGYPMGNPSMGPKGMPGMPPGYGPNMGMSPPQQNSMSYGAPPGYPNRQK